MLRWFPYLSCIFKDQDFFPGNAEVVVTSYHPRIIWGPAGFVFVPSVSIDLNFS